MLGFLRPTSAIAAAALSTVSFAGVAQAQFAPGDLLAGVEFLTPGGPGRIYRVNDGGDFIDADFEMPISVPIIDVCSTDDGRVLIATSTNRIVYDVTTGEAVPFATLPLDASGLFCGGQKIFATSLLEGFAMFDITAGGEITATYASGVNRAVVRDADGLLWAARLDGAFQQNTGGVFRDIAEGADLTDAQAHYLRPDIFAATLHRGRVIGVAIEGDGIVDMTEGGMSPFAHAIVAAPRGIVSDAGELWASTIDGGIFDITTPGDYTNAEPFARVFAPSLSLAVVQRCGDGVVHGREGCDDAGESPTCHADCRLKVCGDGLLSRDLGEDCDDGNVASGDGCSETCEIEPPPATTSSSATTAATTAATKAVATAAAAGGGEGGSGGGGSDDEGSGCSVGRAKKGDSGGPCALGLLLAAALVARKRSRAR